MPSETSDNPTIYPGCNHRNYRRLITLSDQVSSLSVLDEIRLCLFTAPRVANEGIRKFNRVSIIVHEKTELMSPTPPLFFSSLLYSSLLPTLFSLLVLATSNFLLPFLPLPPPPQSLNEAKHVTGF